MKTQRREALKKMFASLLGITGVGIVANAVSSTTDEDVVYSAGNQQEIPMFSGHTRIGNMVFTSGKGAQVEPREIKSHTEICLQQLEEELIKAGSSMEKVLKVTVFLDDIADYKAMNEVYYKPGRFGKNPPSRTTVAVAKGGVPGIALVEMEAIAYI